MASIELLIGVLGALAGGAITSIAAHYLSLARPGIAISSISIEALQAPKTGPIEADIRRKRKARIFFQTPLAVIEHFRKHPVVDDPQAFYQHPQLYTMFLYNANRDNEYERLITTPLPGVIRQLRTLWQERRYREFFSLYHNHQTELFTKLEHAFRQHRLNIPTAVTDHLVASTAYPVFHNKGQSLYSTDCGDFKIFFPWNAERVESERLEDFSRQCALVFSSTDDAGMRIILDFLNAIDWHDRKNTIDTTATMIDRELYLNSRIIVRGVFWNSGRSAYAASGIGDLTLETNKKVVEVGDSKRTLPPRVHLMMRIVQDDFITEKDAINIEGGRSIPFLAVSEDYILKIADGEVMQAILDSNAVCTIEFGRLDTQKPVRVVFRSSQRSKLAAKIV